MGTAFTADGIYVASLSCAEINDHGNFIFTTTGSDAATGSLRWTAHYSTPASECKPQCHLQIPTSIAASPDGTTIFVTGIQNFILAGDNSTSDAVTIAYDAATGRQLWVRSFDGPNNPSENFAIAAAVSRDSRTVYITGGMRGLPLSSPYYKFDYFTIAYDALTGQQQWLSVFDDPHHYSDLPNANTLLGSTLYVAGGVFDGRAVHYGVVAYEASTGVQRWASTSGSSGAGGGPNAIVAGPKAVIVTGISFFGPSIVITCRGPRKEFTSQYSTVSYDPVSGAQLWRQTYSGPSGGFNNPYGLALAPDGSSVFVTGIATRLIGNCSTDSVTIAYDAVAGTQKWIGDYRGSDPVGSLGAENAYGSSVIVSGDGSQALVIGGIYYRGIGPFDVLTLIYSAAGAGTASPLAYNRYNACPVVSVPPQTPPTYVPEQDFGDWLALSGDGQRLLESGYFNHVDSKCPYEHRTEVALLSYGMEPAASVPEMPFTPLLEVIGVSMIVVLVRRRRKVLGRERE